MILGLGPCSQNTFRVCSAEVWMICSTVSSKGPRTVMVAVANSWLGNRWATDCPWRPMNQKPPPRCALGRWLKGSKQSCSVDLKVRDVIETSSVHLFESVGQVNQLWDRRSNPRLARRQKGGKSAMLSAWHQGINGNQKGLQFSKTQVFVGFFLTRSFFSGNLTSCIFSSTQLQWKGINMVYFLSQHGKSNSSCSFPSTPGTQPVSDRRRIMAMMKGAFLWPSESSYKTCPARFPWLLWVRFLGQLK